MPLAATATQHVPLLLSPPISDSSLLPEAVYTSCEELLAVCALGRPLANRRGVGNSVAVWARADKVSLDGLRINGSHQHSIYIRIQKTVTPCSGLCWASMCVAGCKGRGQPLASQIASARPRSCMIASCKPLQADPPDATTRRVRPPLQAPRRCCSPLSVWPACCQ